MSFQLNSHRSHSPYQIHIFRAKELSPPLVRILFLNICFFFQAHRGNDCKHLQGQVQSACTAVIMISFPLEWLYITISWTVTSAIANHSDSNKDIQAASKTLRSFNRKSTLQNPASVSCSCQVSSMCCYSCWLYCRGRQNRRMERKKH